MCDGCSVVYQAINRQSVDSMEEGGGTANEPRWLPERQGLQDFAQLPVFTDFSLV